ncbi:MAG: carboxylesterase family protein, partial [Ilumatobacteraceae bacterium]
MVVIGRHKHVVETTAGKVRGKTGSKGRLVHHLGIPYAAPPIGPLRWKAPARPEPWRGSRKCTKVGPPGYQRAGAMDDFFVRLVDGLGIGRARGKALGLGLKLAVKKPSEDCLTLNVHAPTGASGLPVMVWIHGGDHTDGDGGQP